MKKLFKYAGHLIISEVFHKLYRLLNIDESVRRTSNILQSRGTIYLTIEQETLRKAMNLSKKHSLRINDAIIAQHTMDCKSDIITDNVKDFRKIKGLNVLRLRA